MIRSITELYYSHIFYRHVQGTNLLPAWKAVLDSYLKPTTPWQTRHHRDFVQTQMQRLHEHSRNLPDLADRIETFLKDVQCYLRLGILKVEKGGDFYFALKVICRQSIVYCNKEGEKWDKNAINTNLLTIFVTPQVP